MMNASNLASPAPTPAADPTGPPMTPVGTHTAGTADTLTHTGIPGRGEPPGIARLARRQDDTREPTHGAGMAPSDSADRETRWDGDGWYMD